MSAGTSRSNLLCSDFDGGGGGGGKKGDREYRGAGVGAGAAELPPIWRLAPLSAGSWRRSLQPGLPALTFPLFFEAGEERVSSSDQGPMVPSAFSLAQRNAYSLPDTGENVRMRERRTVGWWWWWGWRGRSTENDGLNMGYSYKHGIINVPQFGQLMIYLSTADHLDPDLLCEICINTDPTQEPCTVNRMSPLPPGSASVQGDINR